MGFDQDRDEKSFGYLVDIFAIGLMLAVAYFVITGITGCGTNKFKKDCVWICHDEDKIPDSCYCLGDSTSCEDGAP